MYYLHNITYRNQSKVGNATPAQVLSGATFTNASGVGLAGTMANKGAWTNTPTGSGKVTIPAGYHNGNGYVDTSTVYTNGYNTGHEKAKSESITSISGRLVSVMGEHDDCLGYGQSYIYNNKKFKKLTITNISCSYSSGVYKYLYLDGTDVGLSCKTVNISNVNTIQIYSRFHIDSSVPLYVDYTLSME